MQRLDTGGRLVVEYDDQGALRIESASGETVWARRDEPWERLLERGARSLAERCARGLAESELDPRTEVCVLSVIYVGDGGLLTVLAILTEEDRREMTADETLDLWYPESEPVGFLEVEEDPEDAVLLREASLNDPREAQRTVMTEVAKLLARRDWAGIFVPTEDFVVFIAEHDEAVAPKYASVLEVNPPERLAAWDARWPAGATRGEDEE